MQTAKGFFFRVEDSVLKGLKKDVSGSCNLREYIT